MLDFIFLSFSISFRVLFEFRFSDSLVLALLRHPAMPEGRTLFKNYSEQKKVQQNIEIAFKFKWKILYKLIEPRNKIIRELPLNLIWFHFTWEPSVFFSTFSTISKKSNLEGVFEFFYSNPQLDQNLKPTRNLCGQLLYIYLCIYVFSV